MCGKLDFILLTLTFNNEDIKFVFWVQALLTNTDNLDHTENAVGFVYNLDNWDWAAPHSCNVSFFCSKDLRKDKLSRHRSDQTLPEAQRTHGLRP